MSSDPHPVAPLVLGHGPTELEVFLEPTCPFSKRAFGKFPALLEAAGPERLTIRIRLLSQPWHLYSGVVTRGILAASARDDGTPVALKVIAGVYADREAFEFDDHCRGTNMERTPADILAALSSLAGTDLTEAFCFRTVDRAIRWHTRYARQMGVHESPSFAIDRMVAPRMSSGQSVDEWLKLLGL
ncbi:DsbA family protein [Bauldia sp.]|uniref:DsbA family protein n=1 Tax=Bauldia sp. TaxID=2575872 RepID=UPI003BAB16DD